MLFSDVHFSNALVYMYFNLLLSGIVTVSSFVKLLKLFSPIDSSELGNVTLIAFLNILVNLLLIPVIPSSMIISVTSFGLNSTVFEFVHVADKFAGTFPEP